MSGKNTTIMNTYILLVMGFSWDNHQEKNPTNMGCAMNIEATPMGPWDIIVIHPRMVILSMVINTFLLFFGNVNNVWTMLVHGTYFHIIDLRIYWYDPL